MSKPEVRSFRQKMALKDGQKNYIQLYEYLRTNHKIEFADLENKYGKNGIEAARKYLTKLLMKVLREADDANGTEQLLTDMMKDVKILHRKGFLSEAFEQIEKIKVIALKNEAYSHYLNGAELEIYYLARNQFKGINEFELLKKQQLVADLLERKMQVQRHSKLYELILMRYWRNGIVNNAKEKARLNDLLLEESQILKYQNYPSFESRKIHLNFQSVFLLMTGDHKGSLKVFYELNELFLSNRHLWVDDPTDHIALLDGILIDLFAMGHFHEMGFFVEQLTKVTTNSEDLSIRRDVLNIHYRLAVLNQTEKSEESRHILLEYLNEIDRLFKIAPSNLKARLCITVAMVYFNNEDYKSCIRLLNSTLNAYDDSLPYEFYDQLMLLYLMAQFELRNYDYIPYQIRSFERRLNLVKADVKVEKTVIDIIKQLCKDPLDIVQHVKQCEDTLNALEGSPRYSYMIKQLQLKKWLKNKK